MSQAVSLWRAAISAAEHGQAGDKSIDIGWMRRRLLLAQAVIKRQPPASDRLH
ncbi:hypothetical protein [Lichenicoccus roseus]|uniref:hypothetical protein n=1 Tax=Lichenicoccus roseus TaxID=2683649 RepID=UPI0014861B4C|nr:hypothetical protein [Lichenicoccus roseus]